MYFDQLVTISNHLQQIKHDMVDKKLNGQPAETHTIANKLLSNAECLPNPVINALKQILPKSKMSNKRLTRKKLKSRDKWDLW